MSDDKDEKLTCYAPIHVSVLLHVARDIAHNVKEHGWTEADAEKAMRNLWYMAAKYGALESPEQAMEKLTAHNAGKDVSTVKH